MTARAPYHVIYSYACERMPTFGSAVALAEAAIFSWWSAYDRSGLTD